MTGGDARDLSEAQAARKKALDRQAIMAIGGMVLISAVFAVHPGDADRTIATALEILPWLAGLSLLVILLNRWALRISARRDVTAAPESPASRAERRRRLRERA